ncbi:MAG: phosphatase PAP2 family protein [Bacteroidetes bacterium]|nr:phosphatase PAP2 family protein [Bacteroidota bacterium]
MNSFNVKAIFKTNVSFLVPYILFIVLGALLIVINTKTETHLSFNTLHSSFFDIFFYYITNLGDGLMMLLTVIILLAVKYRYAVIVALSNITASIITQLLKQTVFNEIVRPKKFFEGIHDLYFVPGVENHLYYSFPSGHATCAFSLYFALALLVENKVLKLCLFFVALLVGYSRIYLSQHFFEDVYAGSLIGVCTTFAVYYSIEKRNRNWMNGSLITSFKRQ